jgi:hypothetical protein
MPSPKGTEKLEFVKFMPGPKGDCEYTDFKDCFENHNPQIQVATSQGGGSGAHLPPLDFHIKLGEADAESFLGVIRNNNQKIKSLQYTTVQVYNEDRKKKRDITYSDITFRNIVHMPISGEDAVTVMLTIEYNKAKGTVKQYKTDGTLDKTTQVDIDLTKGMFAKSKL